ncbi:MAG TPA: GatB/YqeY domain-containing protein [Candidatus Saccharimonadales bacterium]|nr:GatB/YqeY domain-containing protein [Candidatus Saccharimonadales bacterium]
MLEERLEQDLKTALLAGDAQRVSVLRGLKSVLLNEKVAKGKRDSGLTDEEVLPIFAKEAKKRQESADLYSRGGDEKRQQAELSEKKIIEEYLPAQLSEDEVAKLVDEAIRQTGAEGQKDMGKVIGAVRAKAGAAADGALIARLVKEKLGL